MIYSPTHFKRFREVFWAVYFLQ